jgi:hypothetical protein
MVSQAVATLYQAHTTHLLQGLDVVVVVVLKRVLSKERDCYEQETGEKISKANFVTIYGRAHLHALTAKIIKSMFCKTGLWPFNQDVISQEDMALSKEMLCEGYLPATMAPEVAMLAKLMQDMSIVS